MLERNVPVLCNDNGCRLIKGHMGQHSETPNSVFNFFKKIDKNKIGKAGYATPRGGHKGAYQNHVYRNNRVIIPYERLKAVNLSSYKDGYIVRITPEQYFKRKQVVKDVFRKKKCKIMVGENAFVLYRTHDSYLKLPPLKQWSIRGLANKGKTCARKGRNVKDTGHYVLRLPTIGGLKGRDEGAVQGIFAPEYSTAATNFLCRCVLAWHIIHTADSPYTTSQAAHLKSVLSSVGLLSDSVWEAQGIMRRGMITCPLCGTFLRYKELHEMLSLDEESALGNASVQIEGATRSTIVNLFHLYPLNYSDIQHIPGKIAWGHATCNTKLGQRRCYPLQELIKDGEKVGILSESGVESFGWISADWEMIRSPKGAVWIRICIDRARR